MAKDKHGGGLPPSGRWGFPSSSLSTNVGNVFNMKPEASSPSMPQPSLAQGCSSDVSRFSHDLSRMHDNPPKNIGHRRAHSEILTLPDDISFDSDLGVVGTGDGPSLSDEAEEDLFSMYLDMDKVNYSSATSSPQLSASSVVTREDERSSAAHLAPSTAPVDNAGGSGYSDRSRVRHQHSQSMDESTMIKSEMFVSGSEETSAADSRKAMSAAKLAELALIDPKRAKRNWANRQSAARSKERKMRYIAELERKVQTLQTEATSMSAQLTLLQRDSSCLTAENSELKLRLQTMEQQVHLQDALNDALKEEIQHMKVLTGQTVLNSGPMTNFSTSYGANQSYYPDSQTMHTLLAGQRFQQPQIHPQKQQHQYRQQQMQQLPPQEQPPQQQNRGSSPPPSQRENVSDVTPLLQ